MRGPTGSRRGRRATGTDGQNGSLPNEPKPTADAEKPDRFHERPILNSPYEYPDRHWELDEGNRPTNGIIDRRRPSAYVSPIPGPRKQEGRQLALVEERLTAATAVRRG